MKIYSEIIDQILKGKIRNKDDLYKIKTKLSRKYALSDMPTNAEILAHSGKHRKEVIRILRKKPSRTLSGVSIVAVMTKPAKCPHGTCLYCMGGVEVHTPQSYTGHEPATMRGLQYNFDPYRQTKRRVEQLHMIGHPTDKIELIVMGGTFPAQPYDYQRDFIKGCFDGFNGKVSKNLEEAKKINETVEHRCIGMTIETRPDWCKEKEINNILGFGGTRIELGVQNPDDMLYEKLKRGHTVKDVIESTKLCKDSFLKVCYHLMPGLPYSNPKKDLKMFRDIFENQDYKPDMLKIYPCILVDPKFGQKELYDMWKKGEWKPLDDDSAANLISEAKKHFPKWVRVMRIQRDVPSKLIIAGPKHTNLREYIQKKGVKCKCIRCREIRDREPKKVELLRDDYKASNGKEIFLSFEDVKNDWLIGFLRMRIPDKPFREEITNDSAGIRELHVYGPSLKIGKKPEKELQHKGFGRQLLEEAERIASEEFDVKKMLVMSGVGVREYYRMFGYKNNGPYVSKQL